MSSTGQILGTVAGAVIGAFIPGGYVMLGASIGGMIGGAIDPPKGPKIEGQRLSDLSVQTATYGAPIPRVYGTKAVFGNIFWIENNALKETATTTEQGGKGGSSQEATTYSYSATFALGLCSGPIDAVKRIWISGKLIYDASSASLGPSMASAEAAAGFRVYLGTDDQLPDPRMQASLGVANTPAYRGLAYLVFEDLQLAEYGNSLMGAQIKVEVVCSATVSRVAEQIYKVEYPSGGFNCGVWYDGVTSYHWYYRATNNIDVWASRDNVKSEFVSTFVAETYSGYPDSIGFLRNGRSETPTFCYRYFNYPTSKYMLRFVGVGGEKKQTVEWPDNSYLHTTAGLANNNQAYAGSQTGFRVWNGQTLMAFIPWFAVYDVAYDENYFYVTDAMVAQTSLRLLVVDRGTFAHQEFSLAVTLQNSPDVCCANGYAYIHSDQKIYRFDGAAISYYCPGFPSINNSGDPHYFHCVGDVFFAANRRNNSAYATQSVLEASYPTLTSNTVTLGSIVSAECVSSNLITLSDIDTSALTSDVRGYSVAQTAAIRAAIDPLQAAWPFDVIQDGYQIRFLPRGQASVATIDISELGAVAGNDKQAVRITNSREMDSQLPRRVEVSYADVLREYDQGNGSGAERLNTDAINVLKVELPIVLNADEAARIEETLLYLYWLERNDISFVLPPTYVHLQPADVVTINGDAATYEVRLTGINLLPDGRLECSGKYNNAAIYTSAAVGEVGSVTGQVLTYAGTTALTLLDIPCVDSSHMDRPGLLFGMSGYYAGWPGGSVYASPDSGQSWTYLGGATKPGIANATTSHALAVGVTHLIDSKNTLNVRMTFGEFSSVSDLAMFGGANHFAIGAHGRWEIVAAKTVTEEIDGTFTLSNLMRGRFGTEWAMTTHAIGDVVVLLDISHLGFINQAASDINMTRLWRGVTQGKSLDSAADIPLGYTGVNLECLSPVYAKSYFDLTNSSRLFSWTPRSRTPVEAFSGLPTPIGETTEAYELEIWTENHAALKRTLTGLSSPSATYVKADQITDFGVEPETVAIKIYPLSPTVGRGYPLVTSLTTHVVQSDPHWADVGLLLHMDGADNGTTFTDQTGKTVTVTGAVTKTNTFRFSPSSGYFDGSARLSVASHSSLDFGTGDFTVEGYVRLAANGDYFLIHKNTWYVMAYMGGDSVTNLRWNGAVGGSAHALTVGAFVHFAVVRASGVLKGFVAGAVAFSVADTTSYTSGDALVAGQHYSVPVASPFVGNLDEVRITKGVARYTSAFTPPTLPFPNNA